MNSLGETGLPQHALNAIQGVLERYPGVEQAVLYGSRAKGSYRTGSDIDLTLKGNLDYPGLLRLECELDDLLLPWKMDLSLYEHLDNPALIEHIDRVGKLLYQRGDPAVGPASQRSS